MLNREEIQKQVKELISEHLAIDPAKVTDTANLVADLQADSLDLVELVMALEQKFDIEATDEETEKMQTVSKIIDLVEEKLSKK